MLKMVFKPIKNRYQKKTMTNSGYHWNEWNQKKRNKNCRIVSIRLKSNKASSKRKNNEIKPMNTHTHTDRQNILWLKHSNTIYYHFIQQLNDDSNCVSSIMFHIMDHCVVVIDFFLAVVISCFRLSLFILVSSAKSLF